jgi:hypothetical protein
MFGTKYCIRRIDWSLKCGLLACVIILCPARAVFPGRRETFLGPASFGGKFGSGY